METVENEAHPSLPFPQGTAPSTKALADAFAVPIPLVCSSPYSLIELTKKNFSRTYGSLETLMFLKLAHQRNVQASLWHHEEFFRILFEEFISNHLNLSQSRARELNCRLFYPAFRRHFLLYLAAQYLSARIDHCLKLADTKILELLPERDVPSYLVETEKAGFVSFLTQTEGSLDPHFVANQFEKIRAQWLKRWVQRNLPRLYLGSGLLISFLFPFLLWMKNSQLSPWESARAWLRFLNSLFK